MKIMGPAGGREAFDAALAAGADEIYMGLAGYGARRFAANFSADEFCRAVDDAHRVGVTINLTLNTVMSDAEIDAVEPDVRQVYQAGLDGIIVQDWGVFRWLRDCFPNLPIHGSTQMALANGREAAFGEEIGLTRIVLPRELSFDEIAAVRRATSIELEVFCSGALCLSCSGRCYLSSFVGGRSGNRGACAQPCRQRYRRLTPGGDDRPDEGYLFSLKDQLFGEDEIRRLTEIGVDVVKIEGRMKSPPYVFAAVRHYRRMIDRIAGISPETTRKMFFVKESGAGKNSSSDGKISGPKSGQQSVTQPDRKFDSKSLAKSGSKSGALSANETFCRDESADNLAHLFNRGYGGGFLTEHDPAILNPLYASHYGFPVGEVRRGAIHLTAPIAFGDGVVYLDANLGKIDGTNVSEIRLAPKLYGDRERRVSEANPGDVILLDSPPPRDACYLYKTFDQRLQKEILGKIKQTRRHRPIDVRLTARIGHPLELTLTAGDSARPTKTSPAESKLSVRAVSPEPLEKSLKQRNDRESLFQALDRFGDSPFFIAVAEFDFDPDVFIPKSLLNALRQEAAEKLESAILTRTRRSVPLPDDESFSPSLPENNVSSLPPSEIAVVVRTRAQGLAAFKAGIRKIYYLSPPVRFEEDAQDWLRYWNGAASEISPTASDTVAGTETATGILLGAPITVETVTGKMVSTGDLFVPSFLAGNLVEALSYEERGIPFAADATLNIGNVRAARFLLDRFPHLMTLYLSTELGRETVTRLHQALAPVMAARNGRLGLSVYGHPIGMFTRKTLFEESKTELENQDGRRFIVLRNRDGLFNPDFIPCSDQEGDRITADAKRPSLYADRMSGSSVFYAPPHDVIDAAAPFWPAGGWELRLDLTLASPKEITETAGRLVSEWSNSKESSKSSQSSQSRYSVGYGFSHPIF